MKFVDSVDIALTKLRQRWGRTLFAVLDAL